MKAKGLGELGLCGVGAAIFVAVHNGAVVRVRDSQIMLDGPLSGVPELPRGDLTAGRRPRPLPALGWVQFCWMLFSVAIGRSLAMSSFTRRT